MSTGLLFRVRAPLLASAVALCLLHAGGAQAAPNDAIDQLLAARGLLPAASAEAPATDWRERASGLVVAAMNFLGVPYRRGGNDEEGFDCSGFTRHLFATRLGLQLPRRSDEQAHTPQLVAVPRSELQPGDLVFFNTLRRTFSHVGIYIGEGRFIHAPRPGAEVRLESMQVSYWAKRFTGARRPAGAAPAPHESATAPAAEPNPSLPLAY